MLSAPLPVLSGGEHLLFIIYINDMILHSLTFIFADDTKLIKTISSPAEESKLQAGLSHSVTPGESSQVLINSILPLSLPL